MCFVLCQLAFICFTKKSVRRFQFVLLTNEENQYQNWNETKRDRGNKKLKQKYKIQSQSLFALSFELMFEEKIK